MNTAAALKDGVRDSNALEMYDYAQIMHPKHDHQHNEHQRRTVYALLEYLIVAIAAWAPRQEYKVCLRGPMSRQRATLGLIADVNYLWRER